MIWIKIFVLPLALLGDRVIGDPRSAFHPVALLGRFIGWWGRPGLIPDSLQWVVGIAMWMFTVLLFALPFFLIEWLSPWYIFIILAPFMLNFCFAWRSLEEHAMEVSASVKNGLIEGRARAAMLVSRNCADLDGEELLSAAYESVSENLVDSIISPLFYYGIFGLSGAAIYRAANTLDAMLGYRDERSRLGWFSARMDDIFNFIPARITGGLLLVYFAWKGQFHQAYKTLKEDGRKRPGINGGIPMAIMAGGCGVKFEKRGVYSIGPGVKRLEDGEGDIIAAVRAVTLIFSILMVVTLLLWGYVANFIDI
ncbi:MAG TPA: adenosylcobinamide-phosphate synthase CbiB [Methanoregulaceae archaeon]|nr:adenosylcobinamide-phosphate synthase CbiB [Methanoregulaceae archaeon]